MHIVSLPSCSQITGYCIWRLSKYQDIWWHLKDTVACGRCFVQPFVWIWYAAPSYVTKICKVYLYATMQSSTGNVVIGLSMSPRCLASVASWIYNSPRENLQDSWRQCACHAYCFVTILFPNYWILYMEVVKVLYQDIWWHLKDTVACGRCFVQPFVWIWYATPSHVTKICKVYLYATMQSSTGSVVIGLSMSPRCLASVASWIYNSPRENLQDSWRQCACHAYCFVTILFPNYWILYMEVVKVSGHLMTFEEHSSLR